MTGPGNVLEWRDIGNWRQRILDLMSDVITHSVMQNVRAEPPEYCHWEDPDWLQNALAKAGVPEIHRRLRSGSARLASVIGVFIIPGWTELALIPSLAYWRRWIW